MRSLLPVLLFITTALPATARVWTVPGEVPTIQAAIDSTSEGDTVSVGSGTYYERLSIVGKNIHLLGAGHEVTILSGETAVPDSLPILRVDYVDSTTVISGFTFKGNGADSVDWTFGGAILCDFEGTPTIVNNVIRDNFTHWGGGIFIWGYPGPTVVRGNRFLDNTSRDGGAVNTWSPALIENNVFEGNAAIGNGGNVGTGGGVQVNSSNVIITGNVFYRNRAGYAGAVAVEWGDALIQGNTMVLNASTRNETHRPGSIRVFGSTAVILNNIVALSENGYGLSAVGAAYPPDVTLDCNNFWGNELGDYTTYQATLSPGPGEFSANPLLCDPLAGDLTLSPDSPCLPASSGGCGLVGALGVGCGTPLDAPETLSPQTLMLEASRLPGGGIEFRIHGEASLGSRATLQVFDVRGRLLYTSEFNNRIHHWDGTGPTGGRVPSGVYFARASFTDRSISGSFVHVR